MNKKLVLVTCPRVEENSSDFKSFFNQNNIESLFSYPTNQQFDKDEMKKLLKNVDLAIVGDDDLSRGAISDLSKLKYIIKWGSGVDNIDLDFAEQNNIEVFNCPNILGKYVAEYGLGMLLALIKQISKTDTQVRENVWLKNENDTLFNSKIGFFGFGDVASEFVKLLDPFSPTINYCDIQEKNNKFKRLEFDEFINENKIFILTSNLTDKNKSIFDKKIFERMRKDSILINISRGGLINENDLYIALKTSTIKGAALDVFQEEPLPKESKLRTLDNLILGTHNASNVRLANIDVNKYILKLMSEIL